MSEKEVMECVWFLRAFLVGRLWTWLGSRFSFGCRMFLLLLLLALGCCPAYFIFLEGARRLEVAGPCRSLPRLRSRLLRYSKLLPQAPQLALHGKVERRGEAAADFLVVSVCGRLQRLGVVSFYREDYCASAGVG
ncbi:hypothetical protein E2C01_057261 [Portunus trituberculatus]|uniref:Uncharacterized protein n=1 Tax=Portunus trituberculatus TaxID=210409 RepID=A0A5B7H1D2_PORTR|nr:hypothetical protein [Portunus trituberculatus]